jgi:TRAP transporter TAXI family solute receptor
LAQIFRQPATSGGKENIALLANEEVDFALLDADMMSYALTGTETYEGNKIDTFSSIASLFPQVLQIVVAEDSEINSIADLKGKRVSVGDAGSGTAVNAKQVLEAYGLAFEDMKISYLSFKESASAFQDNSLDAFIGVAGIPTSAVTETSLTRDVRLLSIDDEHMNILMNEYAFFAPYTITKDIYGLSDDTETIAVNATMAVLNSVSEEVVYNFTKAMFENQAELAEVNVKGEDLSLIQQLMA